MLIALNKPYGVVCQFRPSSSHPSLKDWVDVPRVYPAGRLDHDSEGLVLLTDQGALQHAIADPAFKLPKRYWVQVEGEPGPDALGRLRAGVNLGTYQSRCEDVRQIPEPSIWPRDPPIRVRQRIATSWLEVVLLEGKNRQVRRTTAAVGYPTLRLIRAAIGPIALAALGLAPGQWVRIDPQLLWPGGAAARRAERGRNFEERRQPRRGSPR